jgi:hypothetical protein
MQMEKNMWVIFVRVDSKEEVKTSQKNIVIHFSIKLYIIQFQQAFSFTRTATTTTVNSSMTGDTEEVLVLFAYFSTTFKSEFNYFQ